MDADTRELQDLLHLAEDGDPEALAALRKAVDEEPRLLEATGDLAFQAEQSWLKAIAGDQELFKEAVARKARALRRELCGASPAPLERLLCERIVLTWMAVHHAELAYAQRLWTLTLEQSAHAQDRLDRAQKRYLAAIRALAQLRRVRLTAVRVLDPAGRRLEAAQVERTEAAARAAAVPTTPPPVPEAPGPSRFF